MTKDQSGSSDVASVEATAALTPSHAIGDLVNYVHDGVISRSPIGEICEVCTSGYRVIWGDDPDSRAGGILLYGEDELVSAGVA